MAGNLVMGGLPAMHAAVPTTTLAADTLHYDSSTQLDLDPKVGTVYSGTSLQSEVTIWRIPTDNPESVRLLNTYWGTAAPWLNQCKFVLPLYGGAYQDGAALLVRGRFQSTLMAKLETGSVGMGTAIALLADIAAGLAELHARGIPHNSITPSCCLLESEGWRGLLDLPLPPPFMHAAGLEPAQTLMYPIDYRAPGAATGPEADVWSMGCVLLHALTGQRPWGDLEESEIQAKLATGDEAPSVPASLPRQLRELLASCLDLEPSSRPKASVLATSLRDIMLLMLAQASRGPGGKGAAGKPSSYAAAASVPTSAPPGISVPDRAGSADKRKRKTRAEVNAARRAAAEAAGEPSSNGAGPGKGADAAGGSRRAARVERPPPGDKGGSKAAGGASKAAGVVSKAAAGSSKPVELYDEFSTCVPTDAAAAASGVPTTVQVEVREYKGLEATTLGQGYPALKTDTTLQWIKDDICRQQGYTAAEYDLCFRLSPLGPVKMTSDLSLTVRQLLAAPHGRLLGKEQPAISMLLSRRAQQVTLTLDYSTCRGKMKELPAIRVPPAATADHVLRQAGHQMGVDPRTLLLCWDTKVGSRLPPLGSVYEAAAGREGAAETLARGEALAMHLKTRPGKDLKRYHITVEQAIQPAADGSRPARHPGDAVKVVAGGSWQLQEMCIEVAKATGVPPEAQALYADQGSSAMYYPKSVPGTASSTELPDQSCEMLKDLGIVDGAVLTLHCLA